MLYAFEGDVRSGKTLRTVIQAFKYARKYPNRRIFSNFQLNTRFFKNYVALKPEMLFEINEPCLILIDEIYAWIESRSSGKDINKYMSYILFQSGKRGMDFIITYQLESTFDLRYRQMINFITKCIKILKNPNIDPNKTDNILGFLYSEQKITRQGRYKPKRYFLSISKAIKYFQMYNTLELIDPIDKSLIMNITDDMTNIIKDIDVHCDKLIKQYGIEKIKKSVVRDYCLRNDLPKRYADTIFDAIETRRAKLSD